jgi:Fe-S-cluster containining protein
MKIDLKPFFKEYETLAAVADEMFAKVDKENPGCVKCKMECSDCCHALFDLSLIEALYLNYKFQRKIKGNRRDEILEKANKTDRQIYKIKRKAFKAFDAGQPESEVLAELATVRVRCPLLNAGDMCDLYDSRPITCRLYGVPTSIGGKGHTCGKSGFDKGKKYPTVNLDVVHQRLYEMSVDLVKEIKSKYTKMGDMLVPVSMALITEYDDVYLGVAEEKPEEGGAKKGGKKHG